MRDALSSSVLARMMTGALTMLRKRMRARAVLTCNPLSTASFALAGLYRVAAASDCSLVAALHAVRSVRKRCDRLCWQGWIGVPQRRRHA